MQARKHANKSFHPGFETQGKRHQKFKTGVSVAPQKGLINVLQNFFLKKLKIVLQSMFQLCQSLVYTTRVKIIILARQT